MCPIYIRMLRAICKPAGKRWKRAPFSQAFEGRSLGQKKALNYSYQKWCARHVWSRRDGSDEWGGGYLPTIRRSHLLCTHCHSIHWLSSIWSSSVSSLWNLLRPICPLVHHFLKIGGFMHCTQKLQSNSCFLNNLHLFHFIPRDKNEVGAQKLWILKVPGRLYSKVARSQGAR